VITPDLLEPSPRLRDRGLGSPGVARVLLVVGAAAALLFGWSVFRDPRAGMPLFDLTAYRVAGERVLGGGSLYGSPLVGATRGVFEFVYPPFAALLFAPLALLPGPALLAAALAAGAVLLAGLVWLSLVGLGHPPTRRLLALCLGLSGVLLWCEPVWETVTFGQVNLLLAVLVLADLLRPPSARGKGALIGLAAGIKLTPLFFVAYLLVTRRFRAAAVAGGAFLATVLLGALVLPADSRTFWAGAFADPARVGVPEHPGNQSLRGLIARELGRQFQGTGQQLLWLVSAAVLAGAGLWLAARFASAGRELGAALLCGITAVAVSPFSWVHHWVWFVPLLIVLLDRALLRRTWTAWLACGAAAAIGCHWFFSSLGGVSGGALFRAGYQNAYVWSTLALFAAAARVSGRWRRAPRAVPDPVSAAAPPL
jgi:alpha-1,2-mannosyltransferase